jgi:hypothetical protein
MMFSSPSFWGLKRSASSLRLWRPRLPRPDLRREPAKAWFHKGAERPSSPGDVSDTIRRYLEALEAHKPRRGRTRSVEAIGRQLGKVRLQIINADPLTRSKLAQERIRLEAELEARTSASDMDALEAAFIDCAAAFSVRKGIGYAAWRSVGVPPAVLRLASISRAAT